MPRMDDITTMRRSVGLSGLHCLHDGMRSAFVEGIRMVSWREPDAMTAE